MLFRSTGEHKKQEKGREAENGFSPFFAGGEEKDRHGMKKRKELLDMDIAI